MGPRGVDPDERQERAGLGEPGSLQAVRPGRGDRIEDTALVGRGDEQAVLSGALKDLVTGHGSVVAVVGDPGIGKSRLVRECCRPYAEDSHECVRLRAVAASYGQTTPYLPYRHLLLGWLGLPLDADLDEIRRRLDPGLEDLLLLVGAPTPGGPVLADVANRRTTRALLRLLADLASQQRVIVELEDAHWSDQTSLALTAELAALTSTRQVLLVITSRPAESTDALLADLGSGVEVTLREVHLDALSRRAVRAHLRGLLRGVVLPKALEERLLDVSSGNPLFLEEQVRGLVSAGALVPDGDGWRFEREVPVTVPATLQRSLLARIDRLPGRSRDVVLAASVVGERFDRGTLDALLDDDTAAPLEELVHQQLVVADAGGTACRFRHALVRDAAYSSLPRRERQKLHAAVAAWLKAEYAGREGEVAARLGRHLSIAGETDEAVVVLAVAARNALAAFANPEAATLALEALSLLADDVASLGNERRSLGLDSTMVAVSALRRQARNREALAVLTEGLAFTSAERPAEQARLRCTMGEVLRDDQRFPEALGEFDRAERALGSHHAAPDDFNTWLDIQMGRVGVYYWLGQNARLDAVLEEIAPRVAEIVDIDQRVHYLDAISVTMMRRDRYLPSEGLLQHSALAFETSRQSPNDGTRAWGAFLRGFTVLWANDVAAARALLQESLAASERLGDALLGARSLSYLMIASRLAGDTDEAAAILPEAREAAREAGLDEYVAVALATESWIRFRGGDHAASVDLARQGLAIWEKLPHRYFYDWMACLQLLAVALESSDVDGAVAATRPMLAEDQQRLPPLVEEPLSRGISLYDTGDHPSALDQLDTALVAARELCLL